MLCHSFRGIAPHSVVMSLKGIYSVCVGVKLYIAALLLRHCNCISAWHTVFERKKERKKFGNVHQADGKITKYAVNDYKTFDIWFIKFSHLANIDINDSAT